MEHKFNPENKKNYSVSLERRFFLPAEGASFDNIKNILKLHAILV